MTQHAQFRELLFKLHGEFCDKQMKATLASDFLNGNYNGKKELLWYLLREFDKLPDVAAELEQVKQERDKLLDVINQLRNRQGKSKTPVMLFAAEVEKWALLNGSVNDSSGRIKIDREELLNKLKELSK